MKLTPFTAENHSHICRRGVASTIENVAFETSHHRFLLNPDFKSGSAANILPYIILLPRSGPEEFSDEDIEVMLPDLQLLPPDKKREADPEIVKTPLETLLLLASGARQNRKYLKKVKVYLVVRVCHLHVEDEGVREAAERVVKVLLREEGIGMMGLRIGGRKRKMKRRRMKMRRLLRCFDDTKRTDAILERLDSVGLCMLNLCMNE
jgi:Domain of unknown function (DUF383)/Domain of unknown function (DUF384)